jgi:hypothetical protein
MDNPSICIPRIQNKITKWEISNIFNKIKLGKICRIDICYNKITNTYKAFIHFHHWFNNEHANKYKNIININDNFKIVYNFPNYWKCFKSKF